MGVGSRLKTIRKDMDLSQKKFADLFAKHYISIQNYENDQREIPQSILVKLMKMGYSIPWLLSGEGNMKMSDYVLEEAMPFKVKGKIPLVGETAAGPGSIYSDNDMPRLNEATEFIPRPANIKDPLAYAVRISSINGDSMFPAYKPQEILIVSPTATVVNNDKVVAKLKDGQIMFKIYKCSGDNIELISVNPAYEPIIIPATDLVFAHKVVGSWGK